jgi:hypothetical protein
VFDRVEHHAGGHGGSDPPAHDAPRVGIGDKCDTSESRSREYVGQVSHSADVLTLVGGSLRRVRSSGHSCNQFGVLVSNPLTSSIGRNRMYESLSAICCARNYLEGKKIGGSRRLGCASTTGSCVAGIAWARYADAMQRYTEAQ